VAGEVDTGVNDKWRTAKQAVWHRLIAVWHRLIAGAEKSSNDLRTNDDQIMTDGEKSRTCSVSARKNILFLANRVPFPPDKGDKIRTFHQLDRLARSHNVYAACFTETPRDVELAAALKRWCVEVVALPWNRRTGLVRAIRTLSSGRPLTVAAYRDPRLTKALADLARRVPFDVVTAFSSYMAPYALAVPAGRRVLDLCDVDSEKWRDFSKNSRWPVSPVYRLEARRLRAYEERCLSEFDATIVITDREREIIDPLLVRGSRPPLTALATAEVVKGLAPAPRRACPTLHVIANGVELPVREPAPPSSCGPVVGFVGAMDYRPNARGICWFVREVWPRIVREVGTATLLIVGRNPARRVRRLARVPGVIVTGEVPNVRDELARCRVVAAPLQVARGLQNKVLEAMAMRRPVVATSAVVGGLGVRPGREILVADEPGEFAERVLALCRSDDLCDRIGNAGHRCVAAQYSWTEVLDRYERVLLGSPPTEPVTPQVREAADAQAFGAYSGSSGRGRRCSTGNSGGPPRAGWAR
jgi:sugar transferase (PEP-CTERM/EpsH1 system associated)